MGAQGPPLRRRVARGRVRWSVVSVGAVTVVLVLAWMAPWWTGRSGDGGDGAAAPSGPAGVASSGPPGEPEGLPRSAPVRLTIPSVGVDAPVASLGLVGGELAPLPGRDHVGWHEDAVSPGEPGSAVLVGSVASGGDGADSGDDSGDSDDSDEYDDDHADGQDGPDPPDGPDGQEGQDRPDSQDDQADQDDQRPADRGETDGEGSPGALARVHRLEPGERIEVTRRDGTVAAFEVVEVRPQGAAEPPDAPVGPPRLRLVGMPGDGPGRDGDATEEASEDPEAPEAPEAPEGAGSADGDGVVVTATFASAE